MMVYAVIYSSCVAKRIVYRKSFCLNNPKNTITSFKIKSKIDLLSDIRNHVGQVFPKLVFSVPKSLRIVQMAIRQMARVL